MKVVCRDRVDLSGLTDRKSIEGDLRIKNNPTLSSLKEMTALERIRGTLDIRGNPRLISLDGLERVSSIGQNLTVSINPNLRRRQQLGHLFPLMNRSPGPMLK